MINSPRSDGAAERAAAFGESPDGERQLCDGCGTANLVAVHAERLLSTGCTVLSGTAIWWQYRACTRCATELCLECAVAEARRQREETQRRLQAEAAAAAAAAAAEAAAGGEGEEGEEEAPLALSRSRRVRTPTRIAAAAAAQSGGRAARPRATGGMHCAHPMGEWRLCARYQRPLIAELEAAVTAARRRLGPSAPPPPANPPRSDQSHQSPPRLPPNASLRAFQEAWRRGAPLLLAGVGDKLRRDLWTPASVARLHASRCERLLTRLAVSRRPSPSCTDRSASSWSLSRMRRAPTSSSTPQSATFSKGTT